MKKVLSVLVCCLIAAGFVFAGGQQEPVEVKAELNVVMRSGFNYEKLMEDYAPEFLAKTGIKLNVQFFPWEAMREKYVTDFASKTGSFDVVIASYGWEGPFYEYYEILQPYIDRDKYDIDDYLPAIIEASGNKRDPQGRRYGIPQKAETMTMYYRTDLFKELGLSDPADWDWDDFFAACEKIKASGKVQFPFVTAGVNVQLVKFFFATYLPQGKYMITPEGEALFNEGPEGLEALKLLKKIFSYGPDNYAAIDILEASQIFLIGEAAMCINWPAAIASQLEDPDKSRIIGNWGVTAPPGPGNIGTEGIYMTKSAKDKDAAWEFMKWFTGKEMTAEVVKYTGIPHSRISLSEDKDVLESVPGIQGAMFANNRSYVWGGSAFPKGGAWFVGLSGHLGNFMAGAETAQEALDNGVRIWKEMNGEFAGEIPWLSYFEQQGIDARR